MSVGERGSSLRTEIPGALPPRKERQKEISMMKKDVTKVSTVLEIPETGAFKPDV